ncbi:hypothetical protein C1646_676400 [Rhizophagus diaphanus]|nr:hypothetical protein C1646_676400 [Rhizophagus diaphanus] [Rhizophagus sp. MUCL 43196]
MVARKAFLNKLKDEGKDPLAFIGPGIVDDKPAIIVLFPDETLQICLPATFKKYPVLVTYGDIELASNPRVYGAQSRYINGVNSSMEFLLRYTMDYRFLSFQLHFSFSLSMLKEIQNNIDIKRQN